MSSTIHHLRITKLILSTHDTTGSDYIYLDSCAPYHELFPLFRLGRGWWGQSAELLPASQLVLRDIVAQIFDFQSNLSFQRLQSLAAHVMWPTFVPSLLRYSASTFLPYSSPFSQMSRDGLELLFVKIAAWEFSKARIDTGLHCLYVSIRRIGNAWFQHFPPASTLRRISPVKLANNQLALSLRATIC